MPGDVQAVSFVMVPGGFIMNLVSMLAAAAAAALVVASHPPGA
jgi:hypothetical protein